MCCTYAPFYQVSKILHKETYLQMDFIKGISILYNSNVDDLKKINIYLNTLNKSKVIKGQI